MKDVKTSIQTEMNGHPTFGPSGTKGRFWDLKRLSLKGDRVVISNDSFFFPAQDLFEIASFRQGDKGRPFFGRSPEKTAIIFLKMFFENPPGFLDGFSIGLSQF